VCVCRTKKLLPRKNPPRINKNIFPKSLLLSFPKSEGASKQWRSMASSKVKFRAGREKNVKISAVEYIQVSLDLRTSEFSCGCLLVLLVCTHKWTEINQPFRDPRSHRGTQGWEGSGPERHPNRSLRYLPNRTITFLLTVLDAVLRKQYYPPTRKHLISILTSRESIPCYR
jgi:hypothetical protein